VLEGIFFSLLFVTISKANTEADIKPIYYYVKQPLLTILSAYFVILALISIFGLASSLIPKLAPLLRIYSHISWLFAVFIHLVLAIVSIIAMIVIRVELIDNYCKGKTGDEFNECFDRESPHVNYQLLWSCFVLFFQGSLHVYFSIILRAYVERCEQMRKKQKRKVGPSKRQNLLNSSDTSNSYNVFNIKVDKTFDDRFV